MDREQVAHGIANYILQEISPHTEGSAKVVVNMVAYLLHRNPALLANYLPIEVDADMIDALQQSVKDTGGLKITIPKVPLLLPGETTMTFYAEDIEKLKNFVN